MITEFELWGLLAALQGKLLRQGVHCMTIGVKGWVTGLLRALEFVCKITNWTGEPGFSLYFPRGLHSKR